MIVKDMDGTNIRKDLQFGFRTVELIEEPILGSEGQCFEH